MWLFCQLPCRPFVFIFVTLFTHVKFCDFVCFVLGDRWHDFFGGGSNVIIVASIWSCNPLQSWCIMNVWVCKNVFRFTLAPDHCCLFSWLSRWFTTCISLVFITRSYISMQPMTRRMTTTHTTIYIRLLFLFSSFKSYPLYTNFPLSHNKTKINNCETTQQWKNCQFVLGHERQRNTSPPLYTAFFMCWQGVCQFLYNLEIPPLDGWMELCPRERVNFLRISKRGVEHPTNNYKL